MREQMSSQNTAPRSLPLLSNCREAEKEGGEEGKNPTLNGERKGWWPSGCEGKLGVALESLQGLRDLT